MTRLVLARLVFAALLASFLGLPVRAEDKKPEKKDELKLTKEEQEVIDLTNAERKKASLPPLAANPKLMAAARSHAENMAKQDMLKHTLDGKEPADRVKDAGYKFSNTGENIAWNQESPKDALKDWMSSQAHRDNILKKEYAEVGVAVAKNKKGERYWVQVFGKELGR